MDVFSSDEWSNAHLLVNDCLTKLLNRIRDCGYNPSLHITYDRAEQHVIVDQEVLAGDAQLRAIYDDYLQACARRELAVEKIQELPKLDIGFEQA